MEHGQRGAESIGATLSGIADTLRDVIDRLDAVAARIDDEGTTDDGTLAVRLAKLEAWAFRTERDVAALGTRLDGGIDAVAPRLAQPAAPRPAEFAAPRPPEPAPRADIGTRPQAPTRAERRELAARAEQQEAPSPVDKPLPTRDKSPGSARERLLPRAAASRGERPDPAPVGHASAPEPAPVAVHTPDSGTERRMPPVPPALHDWVEPLPASAPPEPAPRVEPPAVTAERTDTFTPRYEPVPVAEAPPAVTQHDYSAHSGRLDHPTSPNGRVEALSPSPNGRMDSGLTAPRPEPELNGAHRSTIEDNAHVDKLQAMLDELKRNPNGPFGRPLGTTGEMPV